MQSGHFRTTNFDLANHYDDDILLISKYNPRTIVSVIYQSAGNSSYYVKRFLIDEFDKKLSFLDEGSGDTMITFSVDTFPRLEMFYDESANKKSESEIIDVYDFIAVKGYKAKGKRLTTAPVKLFRWLDPLPEPEEPQSQSTLQSPEISDREGFAEGTQTALW